MWSGINERVLPKRAEVEAEKILLFLYAKKGIEVSGPFRFFLSDPSNTF
jgi:hypothetical protein